jgi:chromosome transmission fidelity protein 4
MSINDYENQKSFSGGHGGDITAISWSSNGAILASAGADGKVLLWDTKTQTIIARYFLTLLFLFAANLDFRYDYPNVMSIAWHPTDNLLSFTTADGELFIFPGLVPSEHVSLLEKTLQSAPFIQDPLSEISNNTRHPAANGKETEVPRQLRRQRSLDSLDELLDDGPGDNFVEDDDGAGYFEGINGNGKRSNGHLGDLGPLGKRLAAEDAWEPKIHDPFQPGSTPWRGNRKYLCKQLLLISKEIFLLLSRS